MRCPASCSLSLSSLSTWSACTEHDEYADLIACQEKRPPSFSSSSAPGHGCCSHASNPSQAWTPISLLTLEIFPTSCRTTAMGMCMLV
eukprot:2362132-Amphidinium_carterae.1